jgi:hypothetical protein
MAKQKKVEIGQIVKVTKCTNSHNYNIGETVNRSVFEL